MHDPGGSSIQGIRREAAWGIEKAATAGSWRMYRASLSSKEINENGQDFVESEGMAAKPHSPSSSIGIKKVGRQGRVGR